MEDRQIENRCFRFLCRGAFVADVRHYRKRQKTGASYRCGCGRLSSDGLGTLQTPGNPRMDQFPALKFDPSRNDEFSPLRQVSSVDAPTLLVHGDKDELVPISHSENIKDAFSKEQVPCELVVIKGAAHGFDAEGNQRMFESMRDWFKRHLDDRHPPVAGE